MKKQVRFVCTAFSLIAFGTLFINSDNGRNGNYAGLSTDNGTCTSCHGGRTATGLGVTLAGAPTSYVAGQTYPLTLTIKDPVATSGGFQVVATSGTTTAQIGTFVVGTGSKLNDVKRVVQSSPKLFSGGSVSWTFNWTAPTTGTAVKFNYSVVASNNDGNETVGDAIYSGSQLGPLSGIFATNQTVTKLKIYPNILRKGGDIMVETRHNASEMSLKVVDLSGRVLKTVQKAQNTEGVKISTLDLPTGRFFIRASTANAVETGDFTIL